MSQPFDVVIVGGGIAGSAMATVLSRAGLRVLLLERQAEYRDRVRGELTLPWGVAEVQRLGLLDVLLEAGGHWLKRRIPYDETIAPEAAEAAHVRLDKVLPEVPGVLTFYQPAVCAALARAAAAEAADIRMGVGSVTVMSGPHPGVSFQMGGRSVLIQCRLVIGADGRTSSVRSQAGIPLQRLPAEHLISGLLVSDATAFPEDAFALGTEGDVTFFVCPQGSGMTRLYLCHALHPRHRFAGPAGGSAFLNSWHLASIPRSDSLAAATVAGPCVTLEADDTWTSEPFTDGVVLIGDAAGYNNPLIGQGLSLAMRDVRVLSELLLNGGDWSPGMLQPYAEERAERMRRVRLLAAAVATNSTAYTPEAAARRRRARERIASDRALLALFMAIYAGPESVPPEVFTPEFMRRFVGLDMA